VSESQNSVRKRKGGGGGHRNKGYNNADVFANIGENPLQWNEPTVSASGCAPINSPSRRKQVTSAFLRENQINVVYGLYSALPDN